MKDTLPRIEDLSDEQFLRAIWYNDPLKKTFRDDPSLQDVIARLALITLKLHEKVYPEQLGS